MRKKILVALLVVVCLSVGTNSTILGLNYSTTKNSSINTNDGRPVGFSNVKLDNKNYHQEFYNSGFNYFYNPDEYLQYHGYVKDWTADYLEVLTGLFDINGHLYYSEKNGNSVRGFKEINGGLYYFNNDLNDPYALQGWQTIGGYRYYFDCNFRAAKGRTLINGKVYLFDEQGHIKTGWQEVDGKRYYCTQDGELLTGWQNIDGKRYYLDPGDGGAAHTGVYDKDSKAGIMYFLDDGSMADGIVTICGNKYLFTHHGNGENAYGSTGWYTDPKTNNRYYFNPYKGGKAETGLRSFGGYTYVFGDDGVLIKSRKD